MSSKKKAPKTKQLHSYMFSRPVSGRETYVVEDYDEEDARIRMDNDEGDCIETPYVDGCARWELWSIDGKDV